MTDEVLTGYLVDALDADDRAAVEVHLRAHPDAIARLDQLRLRFACLEADRDPDAPPVGLALRTVGRLAEYLAEHEPQGMERTADLAAAVHQSLEPSASTGEPFAVPASSLPRAPREAPESRTVGGRFRPDLIVACGIALFAGGLVFSAVGKVRARNELMACQNTLRITHGGLSGYADTHNDRYPQIGPDSTADSFAVVLAASGQVPANFRPVCPACLVPTDSATRAAAGYTYTLGYRTPEGELVGLRRASNTGDEHDLVPISADYPSARVAPATGPICPHPFGMNVLYAGGNIRVTTSALIGPNGDHIFQNIYGSVGAGADRADVVLGRPNDRP